MQIARAYLNAFFENDTLFLLHRNAGGDMRATRVQGEYVTYYKASNLSAVLMRMLKSSAYVRAIKHEGDWVRVTWINGQVRSAMCFDNASPLKQAGIASYEGDVDPVRRWATDNKIVTARPRRIYLDIETDSRVPFSKKEEMRILAWALVDDAGNTFSKVLPEDTDKAERELLLEMWEVLRAYDQVIAWNGDGFDYPVIYARSENRGINVNANRWLWLDHLVLFKRMNLNSSESGEEKQSMALQNIAMATIGEGKDDFDASKTYEAWVEGGDAREAMAKYNVKDTDLLRKIEKKTGYIDLFQTLCEVCHIFADSKGLNPTRQMDGFMLSLGLERGHHFPTKRFNDNVTEFKGAFVMDPDVNGITYNVHVADFASLYPSIILTWNMSPDTRANVPINGPIPPKTCRSPSTGLGFSTDKPGILSSALRELIRLRAVWNDKKSALTPGTAEWADAGRRSMAYKVAANSFYGVVGSPYSRFFDKGIAESVTQNGVWLLRMTIAEAEKKDWKVVYGDTDSIFVTGCNEEEFREFVNWCNSSLYPQTIAAQGCVENHIKLAYEKEFRHIIFTTAKRYAGRYQHYKGKRATLESKPEIKGLEYKRGDAALLARKLQSDIIDLLMQPEPVTEIPRYGEVLSKMQAHILNDALPLDEVKLSKGLSKPLREYVTKMKKDGTAGSQSPHIVVAKILQSRGEEVREGTRINYVITDGQASPMKVIPASDYTGTECDRFNIWESLVYPASERLLAAAFPDNDWSKWSKVRPPKLRGKKTKVLDGQLELPNSVKRFTVNNTISSPPPAMAMRSKAPYTVRLHEDKVKGSMNEVSAILKRFPGTRPVTIVITLATGAEVTMSSTAKVSGSPALIAELERFTA